MTYQHQQSNKYPLTVSMNLSVCKDFLILIKGDTVHDEVTERYERTRLYKRLLYIKLYTVVALGSYFTESPCNFVISGLIVSYKPEYGGRVLGSDMAVHEQLLNTTMITVPDDIRTTVAHALITYFANKSQGHSTEVVVT